MVGDQPAQEAAPRLEEALEGWEGRRDTFRVEEGAIVAGTFGHRIPRNEILCTRREYGDFELWLEVRLRGRGDNAGIQFRSRRIPSHHEVSGYPADMGAGWWGCLYDESRRRKVLARPDAKKLARVLRPGEWNRYVIRCEGPLVRLWINDLLTVDYTDRDDSIPRRGIIGLQIHGGAPAEARYRKIRIRGAPLPPAGHRPKASETGKVEPAAAKSAGGSSPEPRAEKKTP